MNLFRKLALILVPAILLIQLKTVKAEASPSVNLSFDKKFYDRSQTFSAKTTIVNESSETLTGTELMLSIFPALKTGAPLESAFDKQKYPIIRQRSYDALPVGTTEVKLTRDLSILDLDEGVYPAEVGLTTANRQTFIDRSFLVIIEPREPMLVSVIWNLHQPEHRLPSGVFINNMLAQLIENKPDNQGLLRQQLTILSEYPALKVNLAISPVLSEQLSAMASGYSWGGDKKKRVVSRDSEASQSSADWFSQLEKIRKSGQAQILTSPYGQAPLTAFSARNWRDNISEQLALAKEVSQEVLSLKRPPRGIYLPGLRIDKENARRLNAARFQYTIAQTDSSNTTSAPRPPLSFKSKNRRLTIFSSDREITGWLRNAYHEKAGQELTAMLANRILAGPKDGIVVIAPDTAHWLPSGQLLQEIYSTLTQTEWIKPVTLKSIPKQPAKPARLGNSREIPSGDDSYQTAHLDSVYNDFRDFASATAPANKLRRRLQRQFYITQSIDYLGDVDEQIPAIGQIYADDIQQTVNEEFSKVSLATPTKITFSTRNGKIPIAIVNGTGYPIKAKLLLSGKDFLFPDDKKSVALMPKENLFSSNITASFVGLSKMKATIFIGNREVASRYIEVGVSNRLRMLVISISTLLILGVAVAIYERGRSR